jgi:hypothetical protein
VVLGSASRERALQQLETVNPLIVDAFIKDGHRPYLPCPYIFTGMEADGIASLCLQNQQSGFCWTI